MATFKAVVVEKADAGQTVRLTDFDEKDLMDGDVTVAVEYSTLNYKDGLALTGKSPVVRRFPDDRRHRFRRHGGELVASGLEARRQGDPQRLGSRRNPSRRLCGEGARQGRLAGAAAGEHERARGDGHRHRRLHRDAVGAWRSSAAALRRRAAASIVTGAAGGVGSVAIALLAKLGYHVIASTGRPAEADYLKGLGAAEVIERKELAGPPRALGKERWAGGIDAVGSTTLANVLSMTRYGGVVAACGLAGGMDLPTSVAPFILRGVSLIGIDSVMCPLPLAAGSLAAARNRSRPRQDRRHDQRDRTGRRDRGRRRASSPAKCADALW